MRCAPFTMCRSIETVLAGNAGAVAPPAMTVAGDPHVPPDPGVYSGTMLFIDPELSSMNMMFGDTRFLIAIGTSEMSVAAAWAACIVWLSTKLHSTVDATALRHS